MLLIRWKGSNLIVRLLWVDSSPIRMGWKCESQNLSWRYASKWQFQKAINYAGCMVEWDIANCEITMTQLGMMQGNKDEFEMKERKRYITVTIQGQCYRQVVQWMKLIRQKWRYLHPESKSNFILCVGMDWIPVMLNEICQDTCLTSICRSNGNGYGILHWHFKI